MYVCLFSEFWVVDKVLFYFLVRYSVLLFSKKSVVCGIKFFFNFRFEYSFMKDSVNVV